MGLSLLAYLLLTLTGIWMFQTRTSINSLNSQLSWLRLLHYSIGGSMVLLVLLLLAIGIVGTLGHFGSLGHSQHLTAGLIVVGLTLLSAGSATLISSKHVWARSLHVWTNVVLFIGFLWVSLTGWVVVQKYLP